MLILWFDKAFELLFLFAVVKAQSLPGTLMGGFLLLRHAGSTAADHKSDLL